MRSIKEGPPKAGYYNKHALIGSSAFLYGFIFTFFWQISHACVHFYVSILKSLKVAGKVAAGSIGRIYPGYSRIGGTGAFFVAIASVILLSCLL